MTPSEKLVSAVGKALDDAWNGAHEAVQDLPPIELTDAERRHLAQAAIAIAIEKAAEVCREQQQVFLSPQYATGQPLSSFHERFACGRCAEEILALSDRSREG